MASSGSGGFGQGDDRIRTGDEGFADLCLTTWLRRRSISIARVRGPPEDAGGTKRENSPRGSSRRLDALQVLDVLGGPLHDDRVRPEVGRLHPVEQLPYLEEVAQCG